MNENFYLKRRIAHRGLHSEKAPENSMAAFRCAIENNYDIELDIQLSGDNQIVIFHDDTLNRVTGVDKNVDDLPYAELSKLKLNGTSETIPLFTDLLEIAAGKINLVIEIKKKSDEQDTGILEEKTLELLKNYKGEFVVQSFNPKTVDFFRVHAPQFTRGLLTGKKTLDEVQPSIRPLVKDMLSDTDKKMHFLSTWHTHLTSPLITERASGIKLVCWTITSQADMDTALNNKADNVIFENFTPNK